MNTALKYNSIFLGTSIFMFGFLKFFGLLPACVFRQRLEPLFRPVVLFFMLLAGWNLFQLYRAEESVH